MKRFKSSYLFHHLCGRAKVEKKIVLTKPTANETVCRRRMGKAPKVNVPEEHPKAKFHLGTFTAPPPLCLVTLICSAVSMLTCDHSSS